MRLLLVALNLVVAGPTLPHPSTGTLPRSPSPPSVSPAPAAPELEAPPAPGPTMTVSSTAYCLTGTMANGELVYAGAAAGNYWPLGTRLYVHELGRTFTVADRIGHSSELDIAFPGDCDAAIAYGRRTVTVSVVSR